MSSSSTLYDVALTFHRASHVPIGDINNFSCDPYIVATLHTSSPSHPASSSTDDHAPIAFRTPTQRRTLDPTWDAEWWVGGVPSSGFRLEMQLMDEDPGDHDDHLAQAEVFFDKTPLGEGTEEKEIECKIVKRKGNVLNHAATYLGSMLSKNVSRHGRIWVSMRVTGKSENQNERRLYTTGPHAWSEHFSPVLGKLTSTRSGTDQQPNSSDKKAHSFKANQIQLCGPLPSSLKFEYVGYRPFITLLFTMKGVRGMVLHRALKKQHDVVYSYDKNTEFGVARREELSRKFLDMTSWGEGGRLFTYVLLLDGQWRFTETGEKFAIQFLSKHSMHSGVAREIAFSGEFFVRKLQGGEQNGHADGHGDGDSAHNAPSSEPGEDSAVPRDPAQYELVIDNDSGTYRPAKDKLPDLHAFLSSDRNLGSLGKITAMDGFDPQLKKWKEAQDKGKENGKPGGADGGAPGKVEERGGDHGGGEAGREAT